MMTLRLPPGAKHFSLIAKVADKKFFKVPKNITSFPSNPTIKNRYILTFYI